MTKTKKFDPKLRACKKEIVEIFKKYDVLGFVSVSNGEEGNDFGSYITDDVASWSKIQDVDNHTVKLGLHFKSDNKNAQKTANAVYGMRDTAAYIFKGLDYLTTEIEKNCKVELGEGKVFSE